ncbi:MAG: phosphodiester glycosidase family protein [Anaerolineae bacterium]
MKIKIKNSLRMPHLTLLSVILLLSACATVDVPQPIVRGSAQIEPLPTEQPTAPANPQNADWQQLAAGIEVRTITPLQSALAQMVVVRLDPALVQFRVHYRPGEPRLIGQWQTELPNAAVIVNANFFTPEHLITGLLVSDGQTFGRSFIDRGGMFSIQNGQPVIQSLISQPYDGRPLEQAIQAFPVLVHQRAAAYPRVSDTRASRRTVIGMDSQGRVLLMATPGIGLGLYDLSQYLASADLDLVSAFNLDGGRSTMMAIAASRYVINSFDAVPAVLAVYPR